MTLPTSHFRSTFSLNLSRSSSDEFVGSTISSLMYNNNKNPVLLDSNRLIEKKLESYSEFTLEYSLQYFLSSNTKHFKCVNFPNT